MDTGDLFSITPKVGAGEQKTSYVVKTGLKLAAPALLSAIILFDVVVMIVPTCGVR